VGKETEGSATASPPRRRRAMGLKALFGKKRAAGHTAPSRDSLPLPSAVAERLCVQKMGQPSASGSCSLTARSR
jgi:hypothetical protein